jgi:hypothetical protein
VVAVGLISYSLYLWHWPLLVFARHFLARPVVNWETALVVLLSFVAALLSWKFIEQPFRTRSLGTSRPALFSMVGALAAAVVIAAAVGIAGHGLPQRLSPQARLYASGITDRDPELAKCERSSERIEKGDLCQLGPAGVGPVDFVVWGDSHAGAVAPAFKTLANETGAAGWLATQPGCAPLLGVSTITHNVSGCDGFNMSVASAIERYHVPRVYLVARWELNVLGRTHFEDSEGISGFFISDANSKEVSPAENQKVFERGLTRTLSRLTNDFRKVVLVLDVPNTGIYTPAVLAKLATRGMNLGPAVTVDVRASGGRLDSTDDLLRRIGNQWHAAILDPKVSFCSGAECAIARGGRSLYTDDNHLSTFGAMQLVDLLRPTITQAMVVSRSAPAIASLQEPPPAFASEPR